MDWTVAATPVLLILGGAAFFVVLAMNAQGNLGRARFELRKAELKLAKEFAV